MHKYLLVVLISVCHAYLVDNADEVLREYVSKHKSREVNPCEDFYRFSCEHQSEIILGPNRKHFGSDYLHLAKREVRKRLIDQLNSTSNVRHHNGAAWNNARKFYLSCLQSRQEDAIPELKRALQTIGSFPVLNEPWRPDEFDWLQAVSALRQYGIQAIIHEKIAPDWKDSQLPKVYLVGPKFEFVHKEDLLGTSRNSEEFIFFYKRYIKLLMQKLGLRIRKAREASEEIVAFETNLARIAPDDSELTPPEPISIRTLKTKISNINWRKYFGTIFEKPIGADEPQIIIHEEYYQKLAPLIAQTEPRVLAQYILFKFFYHFKVLIDEVPSPEVCLEETISKMSKTVGEIYVETFFSTEMKQGASQIVEHVKSAFVQILNESTWLDSSTKQAAQEKLNAMRSIVGYAQEDTLSDESNFITLSENYHESCLSLAKREAQLEHAQLQNGLRRWVPNPVDSNAFYKITQNTIFVPAGLLVPPIYDPSYPKFRTYGVLGSIIGHELTHGFDFEGRNYNSKGSVENWWTTRSLIGYYSHVECMLSHYNSMATSQPRGTIGNFGSISENVADSGGVQVAYRAYQNWKEQENRANLLAKETTAGNNMTSEQLFFLSFAKFWCLSQDGNENESRSHSSNKYRVINSLSSLPAFGDAFNCQPGSVMNPVKKCKLW